MSLLPPLAPWQQRAYTQATEAIDAGRFGHATLIVGPALIGKPSALGRHAGRVRNRAREWLGVRNELVTGSV